MMTIAPSPHDVDHMYDILCGYGDWFSANLLRLIRQADPQNRELLRKVYPQHVKAYEDYLNGVIGSRSEY